MTTASSYPIPIYKLIVDGQDITPKIAGGDGQRSRLIKLSLTDKRGGDADELTLELSDHDGALEIPPKGAKVSLWLGYQHSGLVDRGTYTVDEVSHSGPPDKLSIKCRAADLRKGLSTKREKSWHRTTLGAIARTIAQRHKLTPVIHRSLASIDIPHIDQADESDINMLSRLARQHDAIMTVKHGRLLLAPAGDSATASGGAMPQLTLTRAAGDAHDYKSADRDHYAGVRASYHDVQRAERGTVLAGSERGQDDGREHADEGSEADDNVQVLRHTYPNKQAAQQAADAELRKIQRGNATMSYAMAVADPSMTSEVSVTLRGWGKPQIDRTWLVAELQIELDDGGMRCKLELEIGNKGSKKK